MNGDELNAVWITENHTVLYIEASEKLCTVDIAKCSVILSLIIRWFIIPSW